MGLIPKPGRRSIRILIATFLLTAVSLATWRLTRPNDIVFRGVPLRQWISASTNGIDELDAALGGVGPAAIPSLVALLKEASWLEKSWAYVWSLFPTGVQNLFRNAPYEATSIVRMKALAVLERWGPEARESLPVLLDLLDKTKDPQVRIDVLPVIAEVGWDSAEALAALMRALEVRPLQREAAFALARLGPAGKPALPRLIQAIENAPATASPFDKPALQIMALAAIGKGAAPAEPVLLLALADPVLRLPALQALKAIAPSPGAVPPLIEVLRRGNELEQYFAAETIIQMQTNAAAAVPELTRLATNDNPVLRVLVGVALAVTSGQPGTAVPGLLDEMHQGRFDPSQHAYWSYHVPNHRFLPPTHRAGAVGVSHRGAAAWWLGELGPAAAEALPVLRQRLTGNDWESLIAAEAIWKIGGQADPVLPTLMHALKIRSNQRLAIRILGEIGPAARPAMPALLELRTGSITLRREVTSALEKIEPPPEAMD